jgi:ERCC4-related helicase
MTKHEQINAIELFKDGQFKIIVATTIAEEGLDIKECNLVVRYDYAGNPISMVQARGNQYIDDAYHIINNICL